MSFPDMSDAFDGWDSEILFHVVRRSVSDFEATEVERTEVRFTGVLQPLSAQKLNVKPEGQRSWKWWSIWSKQYLDIDTLLSDAEGVQYRVMSREDWRNGGFISYEVTEAPR